MRPIISGHGSSDIGQVLRALHTTEVHEWIVGLTALGEPPIPVVAPLAARPQCWWQAPAPSLVIATTIVLVTIEIPAGVAWELARTTICENTLSGARDLQIETVLTVHIVAYVSDLDYHAFAYEVGMRPAPIVRAVDPVHKLQLEALPTIGIPSEAVVATDSNRSETHAQAFSDRKWLVVCTRSRSASTTAHRWFVRV